MSHPSTILITGASSGIGAALALQYAAPGITLILTARHEKRLAAIAEQCRARGASVHTALLDVREKEQLAEFILRMDGQYPIDLVIANAGVSGGSEGGVERERQARIIFETNLTGVLNTIHPLIPRMTARRTGHIALVSSLAGIMPLPPAPAYSASKAAVRYYGDALRGILRRHGVAVSVICPGYIDTPMTKANRFFMPLMMPVERAAVRIKTALDKKQAHIFFPRRLYFALWCLRMMPHRLSDFILDRLPAKQRII